MTIENNYGNANTAGAEPPLVEGEVLRWYETSSPRRGWYAVDTAGDPWHWWLNREWARWGDYSLEETRRRLAEALAAKRQAHDDTAAKCEQYRQLACDLLAVLKLVLEREGDNAPQLAAKGATGHDHRRKPPLGSGGSW